MLRQFTRIGRILVLRDEPAPGTNNPFENRATVRLSQRARFLRRTYKSFIMRLRRGRGRNTAQETTTKRTSFLSKVRTPTTDSSWHRAVKSMLTGPYNFFFVSYDAGFVSVDKPPLGL